MNIEKDLVAASSTPLVLAILAEGENYGYAIIKRVKELSDEELSWTEGMLYPVLHKLEQQGLLKSHKKSTDAGRVRKYYALKPAGRRELIRLKTQWHQVNSTLNKIW